MAERLVITQPVVHAYAELEKQASLFAGPVLIVCAEQSSDEAQRYVQALSAKVDALLTDAEHLNLDVSKCCNWSWNATALTRNRTEPEKESNEPRTCHSS